MCQEVSKVLEIIHELIKRFILSSLLDKGINSGLIMSIWNMNLGIFSWIMWYEITIFYHINNWLWGMSTGLQRRVSSLSLLLATCSSYLIFSVVVCPSRKGMSEHHILSLRLRLLDAVSLCLENLIQELFCLKHMAFLQAKGWWILVSLHMSKSWSQDWGSLL